MSAGVLERSAAEAFGERTLQIINDGTLALMLSVGHRTGVFDALAGLPPSSSEAISCLHCMSVSLLAADGPGLGAIWGREQALAMLQAAGFPDVRVSSLPHDPLNDYSVAVTPRHTSARV